MSIFAVQSTRFDFPSPSTRPPVRPSLLPSRVHPASTPRLIVIHTFVTGCSGCSPGVVAVVSSHFAGSFT